MEFAYDGGGLAKGGTVSLYIDGAKPVRVASTPPGRVRWVQIDLDTDDHDHLITPEERPRVAMTRQ